MTEDLDTTYCPTLEHATFSTSPTIGALMEAVAAAQAEMESATKDSQNPYYNSRYADLAAVKEAMRVLARHGVGIVQSPSVKDGKVILVTLMGNGSGEWIRGELEMQPVREKKGEGFVNAFDPQALGSCITYARRYAAQAFSGVSAADDDGEAASGRGSKPEPRQERRQPLTDGNGDKAEPPKAKVPKRPPWKDMTEDDRFGYVKGLLEAAKGNAPELGRLGKEAVLGREKDYKPEHFQALVALCGQLQATALKANEAHQESGAVSTNQTEIPK